MSAVYRTKMKVRPMKPYVLREDNRTVAIVEPMVTSKGRIMLAVEGGLLTYDSVALLHNWLSDYLGHYRAAHEGGVEEIDPSKVRIPGVVIQDNRDKPKITFRNLKTK